MSTARRFAVFFAFAMLLFAPVPAPAGEAEWQAHMNAGRAADQRGDYRSAAASFAAALKETEAFGETDQHRQLGGVCASETRPLRRG